MQDPFSCFDMIQEEVSHTAKRIGSSSLFATIVIPSPTTCLQAAGIRVLRYNSRLWLC